MHFKPGLIAVTGLHANCLNSARESRKIIPAFGSFVTKNELQKKKVDKLEERNDKEL
jgi:hypothetical protein